MIARDYVETLITIPIYNYKINLVLCDSINDYLQLKNLLNKKEDYSTSVALLYDTEFIEVKYNSLLLFTHKGNKENTIVHETFHLLCLIAENKGFTLSDDSEECYAYLQDYLYKIIRINLIKLKKIKNGNSDTS